MIYELSKYLRIFYEGVGNINYEFPSTGGGGGLVSAVNGLSVGPLPVNTAQLGQLIGEAGDPAQLFNDREIPMNVFSLTLRDMGIGSQFIIKSVATVQKSDPYITFENSAGALLASIKLPPSNIFFTDTTLAAMVGGVGNTVMGNGALSGITTAFNNCVFGARAMQNATTASFNIAIGVEALKNVTASDTIAIGNAALTALTSGFSNTAVGDGAGAALTIGFQNTLIGAQAGQNLVGSANTFLGNAAGNAMTFGGANVALGSRCLLMNQTGQDNIAIGSHAYEENAGTGNGSRNIAIGSASLGETVHGNANIAIGVDTSSQAFTGSNNTIIGDSTIFSNLISGAYNNAVIIGQNINPVNGGTGDLGDNNILIGQGIRIVNNRITNNLIVGEAIDIDISNVAVFGRADQNIILGQTTAIVDNGASLQIRADVTTGGTAPLTAGAGKFKVGKVVNAASALNATKYLELSIDGVLVKVCIN